MNKIITKQYWSYYPRIIPEYVFEPLLEILLNSAFVFRTVSDNDNNKRKRKTCVFFKSSNHNKNIGYDNIPSYDWESLPGIVKEIYNLVSDITKENYDYVLVHIYPDGKSSIGWHNDSEALNSSVVSISLGATRKFRFKTIDRWKGWDYELFLNNGDMLWMHGPDENGISCQNVYLHTVPVERKVKTPRINLTFRLF